MSRHPSDPSPIRGAEDRDAACGSVGVPLLDLRRQYATIRSDVDAAVQRVLETQHFILGGEVEALEKEIADYCGAVHAIGCASGSDALLLALMALGIGPGDQVLCPSYTFFATAGAVARLGAEPVFADIDHATFNLDPESAARAADGCRSLAAIIAVHLFGACADVVALEALAAAHGVPLVHDAAQAIGARDAQGRRTGTFGAASCFSFYPSKNLGGVGDGGLVTTGDPARAQQLRALRTHGAVHGGPHEQVGINSRLDALQAAVLRVKLAHLDSWDDARSRNADHYDALLRQAGAADSATPLDDGGLPLRFPTRPARPARHVFNQYVVRVPAARRDAVRARLAERGIGSALYYALPLHRQPCFAGLGYDEGSLPCSEEAARETLALPIFPELSSEELDRVGETIVEALRH